MAHIKLSYSPPTVTVTTVTVITLNWFRYPENPDTRTTLR